MLGQGRGWWDYGLMETRAWFFQSNPLHYDIDAALGVLDRIWWRVPQYTDAVHAGDVIVLWRSGKTAGIVGIGRVIADPQQHQIDDAEQSFVLAEEEGGNDTTRALNRVQAVPLSQRTRYGRPRRSNTTRWSSPRWGPCSRFPRASGQNWKNSSRSRPSLSREPGAPCPGIRLVATR